MADTAPLLAVRKLSKSYALKGGFFDTARGRVQVVDRITFSVARGQCFGLVGESGSGKTTIARMIVRVVEPDSGGFVERAQSLDERGLRRAGKIGLGQDQAIGNRGLLHR